MQLVFELQHIVKPGYFTLLPLLNVGREGMEGIEVFLRMIPIIRGRNQFMSGQQLRE